MQLLIRRRYAEDRRGVPRHSPSQFIHSDTTTDSLTATTTTPSPLPRWFGWVKPPLQVVQVPQQLLPPRQHTERNASQEPEQAAKPVETEK
jgi:hypothetical protein